MERLKLQRIIFRLNLITTGIVFLLLTPSVRIYQSWFPDKKETLWILPVAVVFLSSTLWILSRLAIPYFIGQGWMKDLRQQPRPEDPAFERFLRMGPSAVLTVFHLLLIILFSAALIRFLSREPFEKLLTNLS